MPRQPNIVLVITDDQGYPPLGCHGHPFVNTPHLDAFHDRSIRFTDFHSGTTCAPTRAGLMTGHYCNSTGVWHTIGGRSLLRRNEWSMANAFRDAGYRTGHFGKWHLGDEFPYRPQDRGFDQVVCHGGGGVSQQPDYWGNDYFDDTYLVDGEPRSFQGYCTDVFFNEAMRFIEDNRARPFFCYVSTNAPHSPFNVDPRYRDLYGNSTTSEAYARFLGMVTNIDENFGRLVTRLQELDLENDTILIFMSDNGQTGLGEPVEGMFTAGMRGLKGSEYEGGHRVPFFVHWPAGGLNAGRDVDTLAAYIDIMPTLLDLCSVPVPDGRSFHGESLAPLLRGGADGRWNDRVLVTDTQRTPHPIKWRRSCVMKDRWRLVDRDELYNLATDPGQECDVAAEHPDLVAELRNAYEEWWTLCARGIDVEVPIPVGVPGRAEAVLRSHDLRSEQDADAVWNQAQVREGVECRGWWELDVSEAGEYEFELRRWPVEAQHRIAGGIEGEDVEYYAAGVAPGAESHYRGGAALPIDGAMIMLDDGVRAHALVREADRSAMLRAKLPAGPNHLRATFTSSNGLSMSAYYVVVRRMGSERRPGPR